MLTLIQLHEAVLDTGMEIGLTTIYRMLEVLTKIGLALAFLLEGAVFYTYCIHSHHHHFIRLRCHRKGCREVEARTHSSFGTVASNGITKRDRPSVFIRCNPMDHTKK